MIVLSEEQKEISSRFAQKDVDRFQGVRWITGVTGVPLLRGALATQQLRIARLVDAGDHVIVIGEVVACTAEDGRPLLSFDSRYQSLA